MILKVIVEEQTFTLPVEAAFLDEAASFFNKMDADMDRGWQMGREWVERPDPQQKLIIVADKLLTAIENDDSKIGMMMAAYIKSRAPLVEKIEMDVTGELGHDFIEADAAPVMPAAFIPTGSTPDSNQATASASPRSGLNKLEAMQLAGKEVSRVFKTGKQYRFSLYNPQTDSWEESPAIADKAEAEKLREFAFKKRFDELAG